MRTRSTRIPQPLQRLCASAEQRDHGEAQCPFLCIYADPRRGRGFPQPRICQMDWLKSQGFDVVENHPVTRETIDREVAWFAEHISENEVPSDGLVLVYDDIAYGQSLGTTAKFPGIHLPSNGRMRPGRQRSWRSSGALPRTGLINPVAIFEPVELEGTTVSRASVHNISIMEELELGVGDRITVYKANMIIPQIAENLTRSGVKGYPGGLSGMRRRDEDLHGK